MNKGRISAAVQSGTVYDTAYIFKFKAYLVKE